MGFEWASDLNRQPVFAFDVIRAELRSTAKATVSAEGPIIRRSENEGLRFRDRQQMPPVDERR